MSCDEAICMKKVRSGLLTFSASRFGHPTSGHSLPNCPPTAVQKLSLDICFMPCLRLLPLELPGDRPSCMIRSTGGSGNGRRIRVPESGKLNLDHIFVTTGRPSGQGFVSMHNGVELNVLVDKSTRLPEQSYCLRAAALFKPKPTTTLAASRTYLQRLRDWPECNAHSTLCLQVLGSASVQFGLSQILVSKTHDDFRGSRLPVHV